jgi:hypothetical protein
MLRSTEPDEIQYTDTANPILFRNHMNFQLDVLSR